MAITNQEAINFSNERIRRVADLVAQLYNVSKSVNDEWTARDMSTTIPDDANEVLHDSAYGTNGTDGDGRPIVDGAELNGAITVINEFLAMMDANTCENLNMILKVAVNTRSV